MQHREKEKPIRVQVYGDVKHSLSRLTKDAGVSPSAYVKNLIKAASTAGGTTTYDNEHKQ
ncbi:hypothetical protein EXU30_16170 [Shewanella maritima]|uniref:CopG family transcriptional regulator n=1 Tax=Shewanella maritima TaxID=2520507 RepID=A0A411PKJ5_9GAMM|nr:hypothetical protein [Shewanella maritima]QBF84036.1 hypothetical protein EXU30_16170 [Shewanella maritima]